MAKRWDEDDDDLDIDLEFDRVEYMKKEIDKGKSTLVAVAIAPIFAVVTMVIFNITEVWQISLATGMLGLIFLKPIYDILNIDLDKVGKKGWLKNGGVYFLTLLAVWIILMNPPFGDFVDPQVDEMEIEAYDDDELVPMENISGEKEYNVTLRIKITSNTAIRHESVEVDEERGNWDYDNKSGPRLEEEHWYVVTYSRLKGNESYEIRISMEDVNGNSNTVFREFYLGVEE